MNISEPFIRRPVATILLMVGLLVFGIFAYRILPVSELPDVDFPTIVVTAELPGATPETMSSTVATPLEKEFSTIAGIDSMSSVSTLGSVQITLQFSLNRNIDSAAQDVQAAISAAQNFLPREMPSPPTYRKVNPADAPILYLALSSKTAPLSTVNRYGETLLARRISMVSGVAQVSIYGSQKYAVRIQANPQILKARGISLDTIVQAVRRNNVNLPTGNLEAPKQSYLIRVDGQLEDAAAFRPLVVNYVGGAPLRLQDLAVVKDSVENDKVASWYNGERSIVLAVQRQPGANTISVVDEIKKILPLFKETLPANIQIQVIYDRSISIRESIRDVQHTLIIAGILVVLVIFLFLRNWSATLIPSVTLPLAVIGTFGFMYLFGFNLDNLSLLALTLSVGYIVDDAIVMLENIFRHYEMGETPLIAALNGSKQIAFTIVSMTTSLVAVFIPVLFMGGLLGRLLHEFAVTISCAILLSGVIALTLTPMLSRYWIRGSLSDQKKPWQQAIEKQYQKMLQFYDRSLLWVLRHKTFILVIFFVTLLLSAILFYIIPKGFLPSEDTGQIFAYTEADPSVSFEAMAQRQQAIATIIQQDANVEGVMSSVGAGGPTPTTNTGRIFIRLKPRHERALTADEVIQELRKKISKVPGITAYLQNLASIRIGRISKSTYQFTLQDTNRDELNHWAKVLTDRIAQLPGFHDVTNDLQYTGPQIQVRINRDKAASLGISAEQIENTLAYAYGTQQISYIYTSEDQYQVVLEVLPEFQTNPNALAQLYMLNNNNQLVPLSAVATFEPGIGLLSVNHQGQMPSITISFNLALNKSIGQAVNAINELKSELPIPPTLVTSFQGTAQTFQTSMTGLGLLLLLAIAVIYIVLGILYESFIHPLTILSGLPAAGVGALIALMIFRIDLNLYSFIGIIMLIGIVKKNAIMMIDFAVTAEREGKSSRDAIYEACLVRFRPIMMTTFAAFMGVLPIAIAFGAGSEVRRPLGIAVAGGLFVSQLLTLYITPVIYLYLDSLQRKQ